MRELECRACARAFKVGLQSGSTLCCECEAEFASSSGAVSPQLEILAHEARFRDAWRTGRAQWTAWVAKVLGKNIPRRNQR